MAFLPVATMPTDHVPPPSVAPAPSPRTPMANGARMHPSPATTPHDPAAQASWTAADLERVHHALQVLDTNSVPPGWATSEPSVRHWALKAVAKLFEFTRLETQTSPLREGLHAFLLKIARREHIAGEFLPLDAQKAARTACGDACRDAIASDAFLKLEWPRRLEVLRVALLLKQAVPLVTTGIFEGFRQYFARNALRESAEARRYMEDMLHKIVHVKGLLAPDDPAFKVLLAILVPRPQPQIVWEVPLSCVLLPQVSENPAALALVLSRLLAVKSPTDHYSKMFEAASPTARVHLMAMVLSTNNLDDTRRISLLKSLRAEIRPPEEQVVLWVLNQVKNRTEIPVTTARIELVGLALRRLLLLSVSRSVAERERLIRLIVAWHTNLSFNYWPVEVWHAPIALQGLLSILSTTSVMSIGIPLDLKSVLGLTSFVCSNFATSRAIGLETLFVLMKQMFVGSLNPSPMDEESLKASASVFAMLEQLEESTKNISVLDSNLHPIWKVRILQTIWATTTEASFAYILTLRGGKFSTPVAALITHAATFSYGKVDSTGENTRYPDGLAPEALKLLRETDRVICLGSRIRTFPYFNRVVSAPASVEGTVFLERHTDPDWITKVVRKGDVTTVDEIVNANRLPLEAALYVITVRPGIALGDDVASKICGLIQAHPRKIEVLESQEYSETIPKLSHNLRVLGNRGVGTAALVALALPKVSPRDGRWAPRVRSTGEDKQTRFQIGRPQDADGSQEKYLSLQVDAIGTPQPAPKRRRTGLNFQDYTLGASFDAELLDTLRAGGDFRAYLEPMCGDVAVSAVLRNGTVHDWSKFFNALARVADAAKLKRIARVLLERLENLPRDIGEATGGVSLALSVLRSLLRTTLTKETFLSVTNLLRYDKVDKSNIEQVFKQELGTSESISLQIKAILALHHPDQLVPLVTDEVEHEILRLDPTQFGTPYDDVAQDLIRAMLMHAPEIGLEPQQGAKTTSLREATESLGELARKNRFVVVRLLPLLLRPVENMLRFHLFNESHRGENLELVKRCVELVSRLTPWVERHPDFFRGFVESVFDFLLGGGRGQNGVPQALGDCTIGTCKLVRCTGGLKGDSQRKKLVQSVVAVMRSRGKLPHVVEALQALL